MLELLGPQTTDMHIAPHFTFGPWTCCSSAPGSIADPAQLSSADSEWIAAAVPGTIAGALDRADRWDMQHPPAIDSFDWWYRTTFARPDVSEPHAAWTLAFDGLATLAEVWLNGNKLLVTDNMFRRYRLDLSSALQAENELVIAFRSVSADLQQKRPRPRWKTNLVNHQQLRWRRTTLLGRIPGWSPPVPTIGPWRDIRLEQSSFELTDLHLSTRVDGTAGIVTFRARRPGDLSSAQATLHVGDHQGLVDLSQTDDGTWFSGELTIPDVNLWWPHTHGAQPLSACQLVIESDGGCERVDCGRVGFRTVTVNQSQGFSIELNGQPVFCRGACWTVSDIFSLDGSETSLRRDLTLARDAGANMLRIGGTMVYESDLFYRLCDELGIFVWQDFMFANMDYPVDDPEFSENIHHEAVDQLRRLASHPSVVVYCGNSEVEQQAAMLGMPRESWSNNWFSTQLPVLCDEHHPGTIYVPATPTGGVLPFHPSSGISHYYGVGAYLRSPAELRQADVKFTPECLGFSNIPEPETINAITDGALTVTHHPRWKQRVPRDTGAGWDFEDVRDHYLKQTYGLDPVTLRSSDLTRYLELSRIVTGEMMSRAFSEWRSRHSHNAGALVWFFKDLWPAAGWGVLDSTGTPKAAYYFLKRCWRDRQITITDEGLNGLHLHLTNEQPAPLPGFVEVTLWKEPHVIVARHEVPIQLNGRDRQLLNVDSLLGGFYDVSYAYRFGPAHHDVVVATLFDTDHQILSDATHFIQRRESRIAPAAIEAAAVPIGHNEYQLTLQSDRFLHNVRLSAKGFLPDDNYFHQPPQRSKVIRWSAVGELPKTFRIEVEALNLETPVTVTCAKNRG